MKRTTIICASVMALVAIMLLPTVASADTFDAAPTIADSVGINSMWVIVAGVSRDVHAGRVRVPRDRLLARQERRHRGGEGPDELLDRRARVLGRAASPSRSAAPATSSGRTGFFLKDFGDPQTAFPIMGLSDATVEAKWFFQFVFCAVSLAIVWGTTLERIKFGVYAIYAVVFAAVIYPIGSHWVFGGGWLQVNLGMQDFAGSTAVHLIGATGALAVLLHLGPRRGKYGPDGKPRAIPGHNMPLFGLSIFILWLGWFGFNPGSTLNALDGRFTEVVVTTQLAACAGVLTAIVTAKLLMKTIDIGMAGNGAIAALVAITAPLGLRVPWAAVVIGAVAGVLVVVSVISRSTRSSTTRSARSPRTAWPASGARSRAACSPTRPSPRTTRSATAASSTPARSTSSASRRSAW